MRRRYDRDEASAMVREICDSPFGGLAAIHAVTNVHRSTIRRWCDGEMSPTGKHYRALLRLHDGLRLRMPKKTPAEAGREENRR
jgi:hypothetical protein